MNAQDMPIGSTTTTEELIVQYLDGELQRKELETVLFERLAKNEEARRLLREHLVIRGAIRSSMNDARFELSVDLDQRTRARIEEALKALPIDGGLGDGGLGDAEPVRIDPTKRRLQRWAVRPAYAALLVLFAVAGTWFVTRSTTSTHSDVAVNTPKSVEPSQAATSTAVPASTSEAPKVIVKEKIVEKPVVRYIATATRPANDIAENAASANPTVSPKQEDASSPADLMISTRYSKLLKATAKQEVVVTSHDRL